MQEGGVEYADVAMACELAETKQSLEKAREESDHMAQYLSTLKQELDQTKRELHRFKMRAFEKRDFNLEKEHLKYMEDSKEIRENDDNERSVEFQRKKCVTFANPPMVAQVAVPPPPAAAAAAMFQRHPSLKKKKKKPLIPFIGGLFSRKKGSSEISFA